jgi:hypothetical protein
MASASDVRGAAPAEALPTAVTSLPAPLRERIFVSLPVDARAQAACVCRAWRDALLSPALWAVLDFRGVPWQRQTVTLLRGAAARAGDQLRVLYAHDFDPADLLDVVGANGSSLRRLWFTVPSPPWPKVCSGETLRALAQAAPLLHTLETYFVKCSCEDASALLRKQAPFSAVRLTKLVVNCDENDDERPSSAERIRPFLEALADPTLQPSVEAMITYADLRQPAVAALLAEATLARRWDMLTLSLCTLPPAVQLARLLSGSELKTLYVSGVQQPVFPNGGPAWDEAQTAVFADAVRTNTTLTTLELSGSRVLLNMPTAAVLLRALVAHKSLQTLRLGESASGPDALGPALAALVAADAPALRNLDVSAEAPPFLSEAILAPILDALQHNHHLRWLNLGDVDISEAFARERLLPAVRANMSLRSLTVGCIDEESPAAEVLEEAVALVEARPPVD